MIAPGVHAIPVRHPWTFSCSSKPCTKWRPTCPASSSRERTLKDPHLCHREIVSPPFLSHSSSPQPGASNNGTQVYVHWRNQRVNREGNGALPCLSKAPLNVRVPACGYLFVICRLLGAACRLLEAVFRGSPRGHGFNKKDEISDLAAGSSPPRKGSFRGHFQQQLRVSDQCTTSFLTPATLESRQPFQIPSSWSLKWRSRVKSTLAVPSQV